MSHRFEHWKVCCLNVPREQVIFITQVSIAFIVIIVSLLNITLTNNETCFWTSLITGALGYLLPGPRRLKDDTLLHDTPLEFVDGCPPEEHSGDVHDCPPSPCGSDGRLGSSVDGDKFSRDEVQRDERGALASAK